MRQYLSYPAILFAMLIWAASGIAIKQALIVFPPLTLIVLRFTLAVILMLGIGLACRNNTMLGLQRLERKDLPLFLLGALFQPFLYYLLETYAYQALSSPTIAEALLSTSPLLSPLFALIIVREKVTRNNIIGILISTIGVLMLILTGSRDFALGNAWGVFWAFAAVSAAILYTIVLRRIPERYNSLSIVFYIQALSLLFFYPLWGIREGHSGLLTLLNAETTHQWWLSTASVAYLALFSSVTAFILFCYSVRQIGVTRANAFNNARPVFTALIMLCFFHEHLPWGKVIGIILIIIGLFISQRRVES